MTDVLFFIIIFDMTHHITRRYQQKDVLEMLNISAGTLQTYLWDGLIKPVVFTKGRGTTRYYSPADLVMIKIVHTVSRHGYSREIVNKLCEFLNTEVEGKKEKDILLDPEQINPNDVVLLRMQHDKWTISESLAHDEMVGKKKLHAHRPTIGEIVNDDELLLWVNIQKIKRQVLKKMGV